MVDPYCISITPVSKSQEFKVMIRFHTVNEGDDRAWKTAVDDGATPVETAFKEKASVMFAEAGWALFSGRRGRALGTISTMGSPESSATETEEVDNCADYETRCLGEKDPCHADGTPTKEDACEAKAGACKYTWKAYDAACDDKDATTMDDRCLQPEGAGKDGEGGICMGVRDCVMGEWQWQNDGKCAVTADGKTHARTGQRSVVTEGNARGTQCGEAGHEYTMVDYSSCPRKDCKMTEWNAFSACADSGDAATGWRRSRSRSVYQKPKNGGTPCSVIGGTTQSEVCPPVDCVVGLWGKYGENEDKLWREECTQSDNLEYYRSRSAPITTKPANGGAECPAGCDLESEQCHEYQLCEPEDCAPGWSLWSDCSKTCGEGSISRQFSTLLKEAKYGGTCPESKVETEPCNEGTCCPQFEPHKSLAVVVDESTTDVAQGDKRVLTCAAGYSSVDKDIEVICDQGKWGEQDLQCDLQCRRRRDREVLTASNRGPHRARSTYAIQRGQRCRTRDGRRLSWEAPASSSAS